MKYTDKSIKKSLINALKAQAVDGYCIVSFDNGIVDELPQIEMNVKTLSEAIELLDNDDIEFVELVFNYSTYTPRVLVRKIVDV